MSFITKKQPLEMRQKNSRSILDKYENRKPLIITDEKKNIHKILPQDSHTVSVILIPLRKKMKIHPTDSIYLFINNKIMPNPADKILNLYNEYKDEDGFLYMDVRKENTFG